MHTVTSISTAQIQHTPQTAPPTEITALNQKLVKGSNTSSQLQKDSTVKFMSPINPTAEKLPTTNTVVSIYSSMLNKGEIWSSLDKRADSIQSIKNLSAQNLTVLQKNTSPFENAFLERFLKQDFYLTHFSDKDFRNPDGESPLVS